MGLNKIMLYNIMYINDINNIICMICGFFTACHIPYPQPLAKGVITESSFDNRVLKKAACQSFRHFHEAFYYEDPSSPLATKILELEQIAGFQPITVFAKLLHSQHKTQQVNP